MGLARWLKRNVIASLCNSTKDARFNPRLPSGLSGIKSAYRDTFLHNDAGQIVLLDMMKQARITSPCYVRGDADALMRNEAVREFVLRIMRACNISNRELQELINIEEDRETENL